MATRVRVPEYSKCVRPYSYLDSRGLSNEGRPREAIGGWDCARCAPRFCKWQRDHRDEETFTTLLRTDISAFYDAISHKYLVADVASSLDVDPSSKLIRLFRRLLQVPVLSYSHVTKQQREAETMHQGLCIGNATEGFFANLYLRHIDRDMGKIEDIDFGRYNDDMRIFAKERLIAKRAMLALQERLLTKGLNLNSSKTEFAEDEAAVEQLRTKAYESEEYSENEEDAPLIRPQIADMPFDEFDRDFNVGEKLENAKDAKDFCHFLAKKIAVSERMPAHVETLHQILTHWHGSAKHAAWRLVESFAREDCPKNTREVSEGALIKCLADPNVTNYAKYRLLHHLVRPRTTHDRYCERLQRGTIRELRRLLPTFLAETAFELNIIALYTMRAVGASVVDLQNAVEQNACKPVPLPIKNALSLAGAFRKPKRLPTFVLPPNDEEDEVENNY